MPVVRVNTANVIRSDVSRYGFSLLMKFIIIMFAFTNLFLFFLLMLLSES